MGKTYKGANSKVDKKNHKEQRSKKNNTRGYKTLK